MSCRTDISKVRNDVHDLNSDLLGLEQRVASPVAALRISSARAMLQHVHDELGCALKLPVDPPPDDDRPWMRMNQMPIGDQRNVIVQVRGECGAAALAYWTGHMWANAQITTEESGTLVTRTGFSRTPIGFEPLEWRFPLADAERPS